MSAAASTPLRARRAALVPRAGVLGSHRAALAGVTAIAAALRFSTLGAQSFWKDEAVTVVRIVNPSLTHTLSVIPHSEATPPLYYVLAWLWTRVFGTGEVGIRSLSALVGTATVPLVYLAATRLLSQRAGIAAAAIAAFSPYLIWYSQEARAYALLAFLMALSFLLFVRARTDPSPRALAGWALASALGLATHYFAVFVVVPEAVWLVVLAVERRRSAVHGERSTVAAVAAVTVAGLALLPLAVHQAGLGHDGWIQQLSLPGRVANSARFFLAGPSSNPPALPTLMAGALVIGTAWLLLFQADRDERRAAAIPFGIVAAALLLPLLLALGGYDFLFHRNLIGALPVLAVVAGIGCGVRRARIAGPLVAAALCAVSLVAVMEVNTQPRLQRADWRAAAVAIGPAPGARAIVTPSLGDEPLEFYLGHMRLLHGGALVSEVDLLGWPAPHSGTPQPPPGFQLVGRRRVGAFTLIRYRAPAAVPVERAALAARRLGSDHPGVLVTGARGGST